MRGWVLLWFLFRKKTEEKRKIVTFRRVHEEDVRRKEEEEKIAHDKAWNRVEVEDRRSQNGGQER